MLEGITVLNEVVYTNLNMVVFLLVCILVLVVATILAIKFDFPPLIMIIGVVGVIIIALPAGVLTGYEYTQYECTIDESVSMKEVYERYEIIEQRGDIWVLEDRE